MAAQHPSSFASPAERETPPSFQGPVGTRQSSSSQASKRPAIICSPLLASQALLSEQFAYFPVQRGIRQLHHFQRGRAARRVSRDIECTALVCGWTLPASPTSCPLKRTSGALSGVESDGGLSVFFDFVCCLSGYMLSEELSLSSSTSSATAFPTTSLGSSIGNNERL